MASLRPEEEWARQLLEHELEVPVVLHDDGSERSMFDLRIEYPDQPAGAVEVVGAPDPARTRLWNTVNGGADTLIIPSIAGGWMVSLSLDANVKKVKQSLPDLLRMLESQNVRSIGRHDQSNEARWARMHGIEGARQSATSYPGSVYFTIGLPAGELSGLVRSDPGDTLAAWVSNLLALDRYADVAAKLVASGLDERHAFILVPLFAGDGSFELVDLLWRDDVTPPSQAPLLPEGIDQVWVVGTFSTGRGFRWSPGGGWSSFEKLAADT